MEVENEDSKFDADEWMMESVFRYNRLHMYDLHLPVTASDWINEKNVCLATSDEKNHEIWQVALPDDLLEEEQESCLSKDRDFKLVAGGFCDKKIAAVKCFASQQYVAVTPVDTSSVDILKLCSDSSVNVMPKVKTIQNVNCNSEASSLSKMSDTIMAFGSCLNNICIADIATQTVLHHTPTKTLSVDERLGGLEALSSNTLVACGQHSGCLWMLDFRLKEPLKASTPPCTDHCSTSTMDLKWIMTRPLTAVTPSNDEDCSGSIWRFSSDGTILENCVSELKKPCFKTCPSTIQKNGKENKAPRSVQVSHDQSPLISISGFGNIIQIYDSGQWKKAEDPDKVEPIFVHDGHQVCCNQPEVNQVTYHGWHPTKHGLMLSADSEGSLHVFEASVL